MRSARATYKEQPPPHPPKSSWDQQQCPIPSFPFPHCWTQQVFPGSLSKEAFVPHPELPAPLCCAYALVYLVCASIALRASDEVTFMTGQSISCASVVCPCHRVLAEAVLSFPLALTEVTLGIGRGRRVILRSYQEEEAGERVRPVPRGNKS